VLLLSRCLPSVAGYGLGTRREGCDEYRLRNSYSAMSLILKIGVSCVSLVAWLHCAVLQSQSD